MTGEIGPARPQVDWLIISPLGSASPPSLLSQTRREPSVMSADTTLTCRDCGQAFTFTAGEQDFYASRGFSEPSRCPDCRAANKAHRDANPSHGSSDYGSYGAGRGQREMFSATCASC